MCVCVWDFFITYCVDMLNVELTVHQSYMSCII